jgi:rubrerythrin
VISIFGVTVLFMNKDELLKPAASEPPKQPEQPPKQPRKKVCWSCRGKGYIWHHEKKRIPCPYCKKGWDFQEFADANGGDYTKHPG